MNGNANMYGDDQYADNNSDSLGKKSRNRYRTKLCRNFPLGTCRYGDSCSYLHIAPIPTSTAPLVSPTRTIARSFFYPTLTIPASSPSPASAPSAPPPQAKDARLGTGQFAQLHTHDGRSRAPRREQPLRSLRALPHTIEYSARSDCPESDKYTVRRWRRQESVSSERCSAGADADAACQFPPAPPGTPVSALGQWKDGATTGGFAGRYRWGSTHREEGTQQQVTSSTMSRHAQMVKVIKHRNQFFKTKPCRFYAEPGGCIKGDRCNFIHEHPNEGSLPSGFVAPAEMYSESDAEPDLSGAESSVQGDMMSPLSPSSVPTSEHALDHAEQKKNFYPVTWRVVGGGVMMSGRREVCESFMAGRCSEGVDCRYAHPDTSEPEYVVTYAEPPPLYSPTSPLVSPVIYAYPVIYPTYPTISPPQPFALPAMPGSGHIPSALPPPAAAIPQTQTPKNGRTHNVWPGMTMAPMDQSNGLPYPAYSPHRIVDGSTLVEPPQQSYMYPEGGLYAETLFTARSAVRPVSTPPRPVHGYDAGVTRLFAAEMP